MDGYNAMLAGKLELISDVPFFQRMMLGAMAFAPRKMVLKQVSKMQEIKE